MTQISIPKTGIRPRLNGAALPVLAAALVALIGLSAPRASADPADPRDQRSDRAMHHRDEYRREDYRREDYRRDGDRRGAPSRADSYGEPPPSRRPPPADTPPRYEPPRDAPVRADSLGAGWREQQYEARQGVREGRIAPLGRVIDEIRRHSPGRQLDAGLEPGSNGRTVYRVRWASADGRRMDYIVDAETGRILGVDGR